MTITEIKEANARAGQYFFSRETMRFFRSKVVSRVYGPDSEGMYYFVTSEQFVSSDGVAAPRRFTVRQFNPETAHINSLEFQAHAEREGAMTAAREVAKT